MDQAGFTRGILVSIRPIYASKILDGRKTVELRRKFPDVAVNGTTALFYSSSPVCAIVGCARIHQVLRLPVSRIWKEHGAAACISKREFDAYFSGLQLAYVIFFESVRSLKKHLKATDLQEQFGIVPPQSYRYLSGECVTSLSDERFQTSRGHKRLDRARRRQARSGVPR